MSETNNEASTEATKRERPEDAEETSEPAAKQAKVEAKDEAESKEAGDDGKPADDAKEEESAEKAGEGAAEKSETAKEEAPAPTPAPAPQPAAAYAAAPAPAAAVAAPAGLPVPSQQSYALPAVDNQVIEDRGEISALYVGRVIGKGGEMIRDLQARSACRIDVDQNVPPGQPRVITYRGTKNTVDFAKHLVHLLCQDNGSEADLPLGEAKREYLVVPASSVGKIIGRGGEVRIVIDNRCSCLNKTYFACIFVNRIDDSRSSVSFPS